MIKIDPSYDVILTYSPIIEITGHIFECFDYYLFLKRHCKVGLLFFCGLDREKLKTAFEAKYVESFSSVESDFIHIHEDQLDGKATIVKFGSATRVILADGNIRALESNHIFLATEHLYGFLCEYDNFHEATLNKHITFLQDFRVYGRNKHFTSIDYVKKLPFKFYKRSTSPNQNVGMIYMTYVCRKVSPNVLLDFHKRSQCLKTFLVVPYALPEYDRLDGITQVEAPMKDFFNQFDTYIYTPVNRKFDCSPRLVTESFLQNKRVFKDLDYYDVGLETRYSDCLTNLESLNLCESDAILDILKV